MLRASFIFCLFAIAFTVTAQDFPAMATPPAVTREALATPDIQIITVDDVPHSEIYNYLSTSVAHVNSLPDDLTTNSGTSLIPSESGTQLMAYAKWLFSPQSARELLGETLAPVGIFLFSLLTLIVFMAIAWVAIRIATLIFRFVQYLIREILRVLPFVG